MSTDSYKRERSPSGRSRGYNSSRSTSSNRSVTTDRSRSNRSASQQGNRIKNPAGFELLGIGLAFGLCVGFVLGLGFNKMTRPGSVLAREPGGSSVIVQPDQVINRGGGRVSDEELKRRQIETQQRLKDWENETFDIKDSGESPRDDEKRKAWKIIDGLDESVN